MRSPSEFVVIALLVTLTPGPGTANIFRVAARDGRRAATLAIVGNSAGVLVWGSLSAVGVSSLIVASQIAYDGLRALGVLLLLFFGLRSLFAGRKRPSGAVRLQRPRAAGGLRAGLLTSLSNPKLAAFFVALLPQFLVPGRAILPIALAMAATIVALDVIWFSILAFVVDRARAILGPLVQRRLEQLSGLVMIGFGLKLASEAQ
jgi:threonine/homoserine/homoserine lactone efflux protein